MENNSRKKLEELEARLKHIDNISNNPKILPNNFDKKLSKFQDLDHTVKKSFSNNENNSYVHKTNDSNDNTISDTNHNQNFNATSNRIYSNNHANRMNLMTPLENDKNYIVNIINPSVFAKNSQESRTRDEKINSDNMNEYNQSNKVNNQELGKETRVITTHITELMTRFYSMAVKSLLINCILKINLSNVLINKFLAEYQLIQVVLTVIGFAQTHIMSSDLAKVNLLM